MVLLGGINNFNRYIIKYILKIDILWIDISSIEVIDSTKWHNVNASRYFNSDIYLCFEEVFP